MPALAALSPLLQLVLVALVGCLLGAVVNLATYRFAWFNPREISPWGPKPDGAKPRTLTDRIPVIGWLGLRREREIHGSGFWVRPMLIELAIGLGLAWLFWWEVHQQMLIVPLVDDWLRIPQLPLLDVAPVAWTHATYLNHALLIVLMAAASFIDIDEKIIPDEITISGTLLGLILAAALPMGLLPHVDVRTAPEPVSAVVDLPPPGLNLIKAGNVMYLEPVTLTAPNAWPMDASSWQYLALGQACWWIWCFALTPRIFRGRRGLCYGLSVLFRRVARELTRPPLAAIAWIGSLAVAGVWWYGGAPWLGLLTSLIGMVVSGGLVWAVRIVGTAALNREAMGFGDVTLMMMVGTFLGWQAGIIIFFLAPFAGLFVGLFQLIFRRDDEIPYGPFLCLGALFVMVNWGTVWNRCQFAFSVGALVPVVLIGCVTMLGFLLVIWQQIKNKLF